MTKYTKISNVKINNGLKYIKKHLKASDFSGEEVGINLALAKLLPDAVGWG